MLIRNSGAGSTPAKAILNHYSVANPVKCNGNSNGLNCPQRLMAGDGAIRPDRAPTFDHSLTRYGERDRIL